MAKTLTAPADYLEMKPPRYVGGWIHSTATAHAKNWQQRGYRVQMREKPGGVFGVMLTHKAQVSRVAGLTIILDPVKVFDLAGNERLSTYRGGH